MIKEHEQLNIFNKRIFERAVLKPPFRLAADMPDEACFYYVVSGCAEVLAPTKKIELMTEEGVVLKCGSYLNDYLAANDIEYCEAFAVHFDAEVLKEIYNKEFPDFLLDGKEVDPIRYQKVNASTLLKNYVDSLQFCFQNPSLASEDLLKLKLKEIILLLAKTDNANTIKQMIGNLFSKSEVNFKEVIEANIYNNLSLEEFAFLTNLSLSSFKREFAKNYKISPAKYIKKRKLEKVEKLLKITQLRISDIAFDCGFSDLVHLSKSFQKEYGISPSEFRLNQKDKPLSQ